MPPRRISMSLRRFYGGGWVGSGHGGGGGGVRSQPHQHLCLCPTASRAVLWLPPTPLIGEARTQQTRLDCTMARKNNDKGAEDCPAAAPGTFPYPFCCRFRIAVFTHAFSLCKKT